MAGYAIPEAAPDEILVEKSPDYTLGSPNTLWGRAKVMRERIPHLKMFVSLCDPAERVYSNIKHFLAVCLLINCVILGTFRSGSETI